MIKKVYAALLALGMLATLPALGMEKETYPCDNCQEDKTALTRIVFTSKTKTCDHIICKKCNDKIDKSQDGPIKINASSPCAYCAYMHRVKNKQCWRIEKSIFTGCEYTTEESAEFFKKNYPNRILTDTTLLPNNPIQHIPIHQNPNNPGQPIPPTNSVIINNQLKKWLGLTCVAGVACYGAYKIYHWWKGEDTQEQDSDDEQDWETEESLNTTPAV